MTLQVKIDFFYNPNYTISIMDRLTKAFELVKNMVIQQEVEVKEMDTEVKAQELADTKASPDSMKLPTLKLQPYYHSKYSSDTVVNIKHKYGNNHFLNTIMTAYNLHLGLHLYPEDIHFAVQQIITDWINKNPEQYR